MAKGRQPGSVLRAAMLLFVVGLLAAAVPWSDSPDFLLDTSLLSFEPVYDDSPSFAVDTTLAIGPARFADSQLFSLDTTRINRAWGDSEPFAFDNPLGCVGEYAGTYNGASSGTVEAYLDCDSTLSFTFISYLGPVQFRSVATVNSTGTVSGSFSGATMSGTFDFTDCTASGTWVYAGIYSGAWNLTRSARGPCIAPSPDEQPHPNQDLQPGNTVTLDHLWQWDDTAGRFVDPHDLGHNGVTIDPNKPTYLLTHGWDGELDGNRCGTLPDNATCTALSSTDDKPEFAMSSIGAAIRRVRGDSVNLLAWDWADVANPNGCCDVDQWLDGPPEVRKAMQALLDHPSLRNVWEVLRSNAADTLCYLTSFGILNDAWRSGLATRGEGNKLGTALASEIAANGAIGSQLHFIGKSHGGAVLGQAAKALKEHAIRVDSLTTLDTPRVFCIPGTSVCYVDSLQFIEPPAAERTFVLYYDQRVPDAEFRAFGFGAPLQGSSTTVANLRLSPEHAPPGSLLHPTILHLWVAGNDDCECEPESGWNGWSSGECPPDDGWYPLGTLGEGGIWFHDLFHGTSLLDLQEGSLFPDGCYSESDYASYRFNSVPCESSAVSAQTDVQSTHMSLLRFDPFQSAASWFGNLTQLVVGADPGDATNRVILMQEKGDASFFKDIDWPNDAVVIRFDYMFREPRGGENLTVYVDNKIVYYDNAETTLARDHLTSSGAIHVGNVAGRTARLNFVLRTDQPEGGEFGGELVIDNIRVYGSLEADADLDGDRDLFDVAVSQRCFGASPIPDECWAFDVDAADGVGLKDHHAISEILADDNRGGPHAVPIP